MLVHGTLPTSGAFLGCLVLRPIGATVDRQSLIANFELGTHPVIFVVCDMTVVGATVYRVNALAAVVAFVATSTPS